MAYPDFAFQTSTQIALFFINCLVTTLSFYWGANLILQIYQNDVPLKRKILFGFICAMLQISFVYGIAYINGVANNMSQLYIGVFIIVTKCMNPLFYIIMYILGVRILKLHTYKSTKIMRMVYACFVCCALILRIPGTAIFPSIPDPRGWNYLRDILTITSGTLLIYILYLIARYYIARYKIYSQLSNNIIIKNHRKALAENFCVSFLIYVFAIAVMYYPRIDVIHYIMSILIIIGYICISILDDFIRIYWTNIVNKNEHIAALNKSIEEFKGIKHDFNNILQTYSGYLAIKDYEKLEAYHKKMINTTVSVQNNLYISQRMSENPSFFSLVMNKLNRAQQKGLDVQIIIQCNMEDVYIDELDFCRIMAIILDNAIESAEKTPLKRMSLTGQVKPDKSKLFIVSNDTADESNTEDIFLPGYTTKPGHMGQGLAQVSSTLHKYGDSTFNITCYKENFTVYLELKPNVNMKRKEAKPCQILGQNKQEH